MISKNILFCFIIVTTLGFQLPSCSLKVIEINGEKYFDNKSYLVAGEQNELKIKPKRWVLDSISKGKLITQNNTILIDVPDTSFHYLGDFYFRSKIFKRKKTIELPISREPNLSLKLYPYDIADSIHFDNIRFLKPKFVSDSSSFLQVRKNVGGFYFRTSDGFSDVHSDGFFFEEQLDSIFLNKPHKIYIDSVYYMSEGETFVEPFEFEFDIIYPKKRYYRELDKKEYTHHNNSLLAMLFFPDKKNYNRPNDDTLWEESYSRAKINSYINLGGVPGINRIIVRDKNNNLMYDRTIDGSNPRIEDFLDISEVNHIIVEVKGENKNWKVNVSYFKD